ncbi:MAG: hypothetical protein QHH06_05315 [Clostridiales bacterium]|jgi:polyhydroxyalkanoate synthesis regulator phasin|nr:hypothetical protein [Eubacteriales bacterium]MDH7565886.1 hypothetical protein [Clostridiales bacterium]
MKILGFVPVFILSVCLTAVPAFSAAAPSSLSAVETSGQKTDILDKEKKENAEKNLKGECGGNRQKDPLQALQDKKERVQSLLKEGKITKEKADAIIAKIDLKIKNIKEFNSLTLPQKKDRLKSNFKASMDKKVKDGKLTQDKANELIKDFNEKVEKWDGSGYPEFCGKKGFHWNQGSGAPIKEKSR